MCVRNRRQRAGRAGDDHDVGLYSGLVGFARKLLSAEPFENGVSSLGHGDFVSGGEFGNGEVERSEREVARRILHAFQVRAHLALAGERNAERYLFGEEFPEALSASHRDVAPLLGEFAFPALEIPQLHDEFLGPLEVDLVDYVDVHRNVLALSHPRLVGIDAEFERSIVLGKPLRLALGIAHRVDDAGVVLHDHRLPAVDCVAVRNVVHPD